MRGKGDRGSLFGAPCPFPEAKLPTVGDVGRQFLQTKMEFKLANWANG